MSEIASFEIEDEGPQRKPARKITGDRALTVAGFMLATAAAFFPWYVFFNQESFGIAPMGYTETRDLPERPGRTVVSVSPLAIPDENDGIAEPSPFDPIITATVASPGEGGRGASLAAQPALNQPFPDRPKYRLLHVANGRALIEDKSGMYIVRIGSILPDNSRLARLEQREGRWVIVTSNGEVIER